MILVAIQDLSLKKDIENQLVQAGFQVVLTETSHLLERFEEKPYALVLLDAGIPVTGGVDPCLEIREHAQTPVILITFPGKELEAVARLDAGVTDFILAPIRPRELLARVRKALQQTTSPVMIPGWIIEFDDLMLDLRSRQLTKNGLVVPLTRTELRLMHFFMLHPGETLSKEMLLKNVWDFQDYSGGYNLVDTAIKRLRKSIEDNPKQPRYIHTVWGYGYRFTGRS